jgi:hypothetical protein
MLSLDSSMVSDGDTKVLSSPWLQVRQRSQGYSGAVVTASAKTVLCGGDPSVGA